MPFVLSGSRKQLKRASFFTLYCREAEVYTVHASVWNTHSSLGFITEVHVVATESQTYM